MSDNRPKNKEVEEFLNEVRRSTNISERFLEAARPSVVRLFTEVPAERREQCLATLRSVFEAQAGTEHVCSTARGMLNQVKQDCNQMSERLNAAAKEAAAVVEASEKQRLRLLAEKKAENDAASMMLFGTALATAKSTLN